jgi:hypothetical protein
MDSLSSLKQDRTCVNLEIIPKVKHPKLWFIGARTKNTGQSDEPIRPSDKMVEIAD